MVKMKKVMAIILPLMVLGLFVMCVKAGWNALNSGYAITTDYHGKDVLVGTLVTARAGTTDPNITSVTFRWIPPEGDEWLVEYVPVADSGETWNGDPIYDAYDAQTVDIVGDWGVQAWFHDSRGNIRHRTDIKAIRATSFHVIPEVPFGTLAIVLSLFGALGISALRKKESACT